MGEAIPIYSLAYFKLPETLLEELHKMMSNFGSASVVMIGKWFRLVGTSFVEGKVRVAWALKT